MKIPNAVLSKYLIKILAGYLILAIIVFTTVLFMNQFVRIFNTAILMGANFGWIAYAMSALMPTVLALSIPMAWQLSILLGLGALSGRGEILALRAGGFSALQIVFPISSCALFLCVVLFLTNNWISPVGFNRFQNSKHLLAKSMSQLKLRPNTFINMTNWQMIAHEIDEDSGKMKNIALFMHSKDNPDLTLLNISAPQGQYKMLAGKGIELVLKKGQFQKIDEKNPNKVIKAEYDKYSVFIPLYEKTDFTNRSLSLSELTTPEIMKTIKQKTLRPKRHAEYKIEVSSRIALALSPLIFFLVSAPLGLATARHAKAWGMIFTIVILFTYYGCLMTGVSIGKKFFQLAWCSPWIGNTLGLAVAAALWRKKILR
jgi:lipopolysaccharide export system permease protein